MGSSCGKCCSEHCNRSVCTVGDEPDTNLNSVIGNPHADVTGLSTVNEQVQTCVNDICGLKDSKYIIQAGAYFVKVKNKSLSVELPKAQELHTQCKGGHHYLAQYIIHYPRDTVSPPPSSRKKKMFYVIKGNSCIVVEKLGLKKKRDGRIFDLHPDCQGGSHYLANRAGFYIIRNEDSTYLHVQDMSKDDYKQNAASCHNLHESYANGLYYFATDYYFYILKRHPEFGLVYHRTKDLRSNNGDPWFPVSNSVVKFLQVSSSSQINEGAASELISTPPTLSRSSIGETSCSYQTALTPDSYPPVDQPHLYVTQELLVAKPDSFNLTLIKWKNERGERMEFRLKSLIVHKWRVIGNLVRVPQSKLEEWKREMDADERCDAILSHWLNNPPRTYPVTWEGLNTLLNDCELVEIATELKKAVSRANWPETAV